jgi:hypothetical protein
MAKQKISDKLQAKFNKPQFRPGDAVFFSWLGQKQYGYVKKTKQTSWGIQYNVESSTGIKYPCGIQIQGQKTHYNTGYIFYEDTISIGSEELKRRFQNAPKSNRIATVSIDTRGTSAKSTVLNSNGGGDDANDSRKNAKTRKTRSSKSNAVSSSSAGTNRGTTKKSKVPENKSLESAIEKQRNFLNGFIKRD